MILGWNNNVRVKEMSVLFNQLVVVLLKIKNITRELIEIFQSEDKKEAISSRIQSLLALLFIAT